MPQAFRHAGSWVVNTGLSGWLLLEGCRFFSLLQSWNEVESRLDPSGHLTSTVFLVGFLLDACWFLPSLSFVMVVCLCRLFWLWLHFWWACSSRFFDFIFPIKVRLNSNQSKPKNPDYRVRLTSSLRPHYTVGSALGPNAALDFVSLLCLSLVPS